MPKPIRPLRPAFAEKLHNGLLHFGKKPFARTCDDPKQPQGWALIFNGGEIHVCDNEDYYPAECHPEFLRRITACLQYCHGISTEELEKQVSLLGLTS